jgi:hypothetical protein
MLAVLPVKQPENYEFSGQIIVSRVYSPKCMCFLDNFAFDDSVLLGVCFVSWFVSRGAVSF